LCTDLTNFGTLLLTETRNKELQNYPTTPVTVRILPHVTLTSLFTMTAVMDFSVKINTPLNCSWRKEIAKTVTYQGLTLTGLNKLIRYL